MRNLDDFIFGPIDPVPLIQVTAWPIALPPVLAWSAPSPYVETVRDGEFHQLDGEAQYVAYAARCYSQMIESEGDYVMHYSPEGFAR